VIIVGQDLLQATGGYHAMVNVMDLLLLLGKLTQPGSGVAPLTEENNEQGAVEMGATADYLPGATGLENPPARDRLAATWKESVPTAPGMRLLGMIEAAQAGRLKSMFIVGENPLRSLPASAGAREALTNLEFLVVQELFLTETAQLAHVVLPACSYAEKSGTFTNSEGFVQKVRPGPDPIGDSRPDWEILSAISVLMGYPLEYGGSQDILKEIRSVIPGYTVLGAMPEPAKVDSQAMERYLAGGFAEDLADRYRPANAGRSEWTLRIGQTLFHSGKMSTMAKGLLEIQKEGRLYMNPADYQRLGLNAGDMIRVRSESGEATVEASPLGRLPHGMLYFPESFREPLAPLLRVTPDPVTGVPYHKVQRVHLQKVG